MKAWKQKLISILMMLFIVTLNGSVVMAEDEKNKGGDYYIQNTSDGKYNEDGTISITLKVDSNKKDFNGSLKVYVGNTEWSSYASTAYEKPISIEKGKTKEIVFEVGYSADASGKLWYELIDENGNVVYDQEGTFSYRQTGMGMTMGVLTDDFSKFAFLNEGGVFNLELWGEGVSFAVTGLDETTFPADKSEINEFDFLFIDQFYTDKLSEEQMDALLQWLTNGGMLFVGTGANAVDTLSGFDGTDFGVQFTGTTFEQEINLTEQGISDYQQSLCGTFLGDGDLCATVSYSELDVDVDAVSYYNNDVIDTSFIVRQYGSGYAFIYPFSFTEENMTASMKKAILGASTIYTYSDRVVETLDEQFYIYYDNYELRNAQSLLNNIKIPNASVYLIIFGVYMVVATFVTYLVLKKKDKREYVWIAIPAWAVLFTVIIMLVSRSSRVTKPIESSITIVNLDGTKKDSTSFIALTTPDMKGYELNFNSDVTNVVATLDTTYYSYNEVKDIRNSVDYTLKENADGFSLAVDKAKVFEYKYVQSSKTETSEEKIDVEIEEDGIFYRGTVTNNTNYDLIGVVAKLNGVCYEIGDLKKGESKSFSEEEDSSYYFDIEYDKGDRYENNRVEALMGLSYSLCYGYSSLSSYAATGNMVVGIVRDYDVDLIENEDFKEFNAAIYTQSLDNSEIGLREEYNLDDYVYDYTGDYDYYDGEIYSDNVEITYVVENMDDIASSYAINRGSRAVDCITAAQVYFYNVNTGDYDLVFDDSNVVGLKDYVAPNGELRARFTCEGEMAEETWGYGVPYIYVFGGESDVEN
ncbi:MAG: hypothetical protein IJA10_07490 [Lachnospiraceae bacterium]|nr:hypothetical protein [Lachnospiraceae bacterium]